MARMAFLKEHSSIFIFILTQTPSFPVGRTFLGPQCGQEGAVLPHCEVMDSLQTSCMEVGWGHH